MQISATDAKNRFGFYCAQAKLAAVVVEKDGRPDSVIISYDTFQTLSEAARAKSVAQRKREFNATYKDWIAEQNQHFQTHGLWCDGVVSWQEAS